MNKGLSFGMSMNSLVNFGWRDPNSAHTSMKFRLNSIKLIVPNMPVIVWVTRDEKGASNMMFHNDEFQFCLLSQSESFADWEFI